MSEDCDLSVVVTAYGRKEFLRHAVDSVISQVTGRHKVEIIVIKNFVDPINDPQLEALGVRLFFDNSPLVGSTLRLAIDLSKGRFIAFLDDDDLFFPTKLDRFFGVLARFPGLGYYHNGFSFDVQDRGGVGALHASILLRNQGGPIEEETIGFMSSSDSRITSFLALRNREQNLSSTIVSREVATLIRPVLDSLPSMTDTIMLVAGLISSQGLVFDSSVQTRVRRHAENSSNKPRNLGSRREVLKVLLDLCGDSRAPDSVFEYMTLRMARELVYANLVGVSISKKDVAHSMSIIAKFFGKHRHSRDLLFLVIGGVELLAPAVVRIVRPTLTGN